MADATVFRCPCPHCQDGSDHPDRHGHAHLNLLRSRLDEQPRRWPAAFESQKIGSGGDTALALLTGLQVDTTRRGRAELDAGLDGRPTGRVRRPGAGQPPGEKKTRPSWET